MSYYTLPGHTQLQDVFKYLDIIIFVEATIYQMDEDNEKMCVEGGQSEEHVLAGRLPLLLEGIAFAAVILIFWWFNQVKRPFGRC